MYLYRGADSTFVPRQDVILSPERFIAQHNRPFTYSRPVILHAVLCLATSPLSLLSAEREFTPAQLLYLP